MTLESDIETLKLQERRLVFAEFDEARAWALGSHMRDSAIAQSLSLVIDIRIGIRPLFYVALPGTTPENPDWVRRKVNTVYRFEASSYRVALDYQKSGKTFDVARGLDLMHYAAAGGGFPIRLGGQVVGAVTVSGAPQRTDHNFVAECLASHLGVSCKELSLPPETY